MLVPVVLGQSRPVEQTLSESLVAVWSSMAHVRDVLAFAIGLCLVFVA